MDCIRLSLCAKEAASEVDIAKNKIAVFLQKLELTMMIADIVVFTLIPADLALTDGRLLC